MNLVGDAYDNATTESFFATLECELLARRRFRTLAEARMATFAFFEGFYRPQRRHSALGYMSPTAFERVPRASLAWPSLPPCSRPSSIGPSRAAEAAVAPRDGVSCMSAGTEGWAPQGPNERMAPRRRRRVDAVSIGNT